MEWQSRADNLKQGDRVALRNGEFGKIIRIDGGMAHVQLDSTVRKTTATAALKKSIAVILRR